MAMYVFKGELRKDVEAPTPSGGTVCHVTGRSPKWHGLIRIFGSQMWTTFGLADRS